MYSVVSFSLRYVFVSVIFFTDIFDIAADVLQ